MKLEDIPTSCPMYEEILGCIGEIEAIVDKDVYDMVNGDIREIAVQLKKIRNTADDMRKVNGHLRDAAKIQNKQKYKGD